MSEYHQHTNYPKTRDANKTNRYTRSPRTGAQKGFTFEHLPQAECALVCTSRVTPQSVLFKTPPIGRRKEQYEEERSDDE
jgi:hypothetical protein